MSGGRIAMALACALLPPPVAWAQDPGYVEQIEAWRAEYEAGLLKDEGWLTVAELYWLAEGENSVGASAASDFVLPAGAPDRVGVFTLRGREASFRPDPGVVVTRGGEPVEGEVALPLGSDHAVSVGPLSMWLHYSGARLAIRLRDLRHPLREGFLGLDWFPVDPAYRVSGRFLPYDEPRTVELVNILGDIEPFQSQGEVELELRGEPLRVQSVTRTTVSGEKRLFLVFRDGTSGRETYAPARFLWADLPVDGRVEFDFNRAYNPPCAYNPATTCPLPPKQNRLSARIEAGEKKYRGHH